MRRLPALFTLTLFAASCSAADAGPSEAPDAPMAADAEFEPSAEQREEILSAVQSLFDALGTGDADLLRAVMDPSTVMHFTEEDGSGSVSHGSSTVEGLAGRIESSEVRLIERMWDPVVRVDGPLASVWTPYDFYSGETFSHCGVDTVALVQRDGAWTIVGLSWTRQQPPACDLHPDGPPQG